MSPSDASRRIAAVGDAALKLASSTVTGKLVLARIAASIDLELLPEEDRERVRRVLGDQSAPVLAPLTAAQLHEALGRAWDAEPLDTLDELDRSPAAVTPTAQVHRGRLDGEPVAVKVLRPGLGARFRQDFALLEALAAPLSAAFPALDAGAILREVRERTLDEFDLEHEATVQRRVHRALRRHPFLRVPAPVSRLASEEVMVSEWAEGVPLLDCSDPDRAAARLALFVIGGAREGLMHCDPDPADVLVGADGSLTILDFGAVRTVEAARTDLVQTAVEAFARHDPEVFSAALAALGLLPAEKGAAALELAHHALGELGDAASPTRLDIGGVMAVGERLAERREDLLALALAARVAPEDVWPGRGVTQLFATLTRLGATAAWPELALRALRDGWSAEPPA